MLGLIERFIGPGDQTHLIEGCGRFLPRVGTGQTGTEGDGMALLPSAALQGDAQG
jgi:hypothetical protein